MADITFEEPRCTAKSRLKLSRKVLSQGRQRGRQEKAASLMLRMLTKRFGSLASGVQVAVTALSIENLEALGKALLNFDSLSELST